LVRRDRRRGNGSRFRLSAVDADDIRAHDQDDRRAGPSGQRVFFDPLAEAYERFAEADDGRYRPWLSAVIPDRSGDPASRAVDLGCGSGRFTTLLADRHAKVLAVDIAERELAIARAKRARPAIAYEHRSLLEVTPGGDGRFDVVLSVNAIHHLRDHDTVLPHIRGLVAPGGLAVLVDIVTASRHQRNRWWHRMDGVANAARTLAQHRSAGKAVDVLRLWWNRTWLDHVTTNIPLTRAEFHERYAAVFPGAEFEDGLAPFLTAMRWRAPAGRQP
jgi:2-polyprenyl-3-methyl-5-hydroxy-6-metoxy-1,4-benzoquinol methylase